MKSPMPVLSSSNVQKCDVAFGPNFCNGIGGVFGQSYTKPNATSYGVWKIWLWLPDTYKYSTDYWNWEGSGFTLNTWVGEYNSTSGVYVQYGQDITLNQAAKSTITLLSAIVYFGFNMF